MVRFFKLNNIDEFKCLADKCPDTCCSGWMIEIDEASLGKYKAVSGSYSSVLDERIDYTEKVFKQKESGDCSFLCSSKLCDMYSNLGEASLCDTCRLYPRHIEEFLNVREMTLSISCPEAARLLLESEVQSIFREVSEEEFDKAEFQKKEFHNEEFIKEKSAQEISSDEDDYEDFDSELYEQLLAARQALIEVMQNRELSYNERAEAVVNMATKLQDELDGFEPVDLEGTRIGTYDFARELFVCLKELEHLKAGRGAAIDAAAKLLYDSGEAGWQQNKSDFAKYCISSGINTELMKEQLTVYYLYAYFCGAVYDDYVAAKAYGAIVHPLLIEELWTARWLENGKELSIEDMVRVVYEYARELENSNPNLIKTDEMLDEICFAN